MATELDRAEDSRTHTGNEAELRRAAEDARREAEATRREMAEAVEAAKREAAEMWRCEMAAAVDAVKQEMARAAQAVQQPAPVRQDSEAVKQLAKEEAVRREAEAMAAVARQEADAVKQEMTAKVAAAKQEAEECAEAARREAEAARLELEALRQSADIPGDAVEDRAAQAEDRAAQAEDMAAQAEDRAAQSAPPSSGDSPEMVELKRELAEAKEEAEREKEKAEREKEKATAELERERQRAKLDTTRLQKELRAAKAERDETARQAETPEQVAQREADAACTFAIEELEAKRKELEALRPGRGFVDASLHAQLKEVETKREALAELHASLREPRPSVGDRVRIVSGVEAVGKDGTIIKDDRDSEPFQVEYAIDDADGVARKGTRWCTEAHVITVQNNSAPVFLVLTTVGGGRVEARVGRRQTSEAKLAEEAKLRGELRSLQEALEQAMEVKRKARFERVDKAFNALREELHTYVRPHDGRATHALRVKGAVLELAIRKDEWEERQRAEPVADELTKQLGVRREALRQKQRELRAALGEIKTGDSVMVLATGKEAIVQNVLGSSLSVRGVGWCSEEELLLLNAEQKALRTKEEQLCTALRPDEDRVRREHEAKLRAPVDEAEELLRSLADEVLRRAREQAPVLERMASDLSALPDILDVVELGDAERWRGVSHLRACMRASQRAVGATHEALDRVVEEGPATSRAGYLRTLEERIGKKPTRHWEEEWVSLIADYFGCSHEKVLASYMPEQMRSGFQSQVISEMKDAGLSPQEANMAGILIFNGAAIGRALREGNPRYAATTYALSEVLFARRHSSGSVPERVYTHRNGWYLSLTDIEPNWERLEVPDGTGFCGLTSAAPTNATLDYKAFTTSGFCSRLTGTDGSSTYEQEDSDVIAIDSAPDDDHGAHAAIMVSKTDALFPPNTLFRLKEILQPGEWEAPQAPPQGHHPGSKCAKSSVSPILGNMFQRREERTVHLHDYEKGSPLWIGEDDEFDLRECGSRVVKDDNRLTPLGVKVGEVMFTINGEECHAKSDWYSIRERVEGTLAIGIATLTELCEAEYDKLPAVEQSNFTKIEPTLFQPAPPKLFPNQRLLVCTATYQEPAAAKADAGSGGKMCVSNISLKYGSRAAYIKGLDDLIAKPVLTMAMEFAREQTWTDWQGVSYTLREEWAYVTGAAKCTSDCTPGTRDEHNNGKTPEDFLASANGFILSRRKAAKREERAVLPEEAAFLTLDEVLAVRLYSGPAFQPINVFLRQISSLTGAFREELAHHAGLTFAATVGHICRAIRKLAAVATPEEATAPLWRGVRGVLPKTFWVPDEQGIVCAVDMAFMSTSRNRSTPIQYMAGDGMENVLWCLQPAAESDSAYHRGADISRLSQFAGEEEGARGGRMRRQRLLLWVCALWPSHSHARVPISLPLCARSALPAVHDARGAQGGPTRSRDDDLPRGGEGGD